MKKQLFIISVFFVSSTCGMNQAVVPDPAGGAQIATPMPAEPSESLFQNTKQVRRFFARNPDALAEYQRQRDAETRQCSDEAQHQRLNPSDELRAADYKNAQLRAEIGNLFFVFPTTKRAWLTELAVEYTLGQNELQRVTKENTNLEKKLTALAAKRIGVCAGIGGVAGAIIALYTRHASPKTVAGCAALGATTVGIAVPVALTYLETK